MRKLLCLIILFGYLRSQAQPGTIDSTFNAPDIQGKHSQVAVQPDGKILIATLENAFSARLRRLNTDGTLDTSFKPDVQVFTQVGESVYAFISAIVFQPDGKILIGGTFDIVNGVNRNSIARLHATGELDMSFDPGAGPVGPNWDTTYRFVSAIALQSDGKIIIGGNFLTYRGTILNDVARLNGDGTLDTGFYAPVHSAAADSYVSTITVQPDQKIILSGMFYFVRDTIARTSIVRLNSNSTVDTTFIPPVIGITGHAPRIKRHVVLANGRIVVAGEFNTVNGQARIGLARLNEDGSVDTSLSTALNQYWNLNYRLGSLHVQQDGRMVLMNQEHVFRLSADGELDSTYSILNTRGGFVASAMHSNERLLLAGSFDSVYVSIINSTVAVRSYGFVRLMGDFNAAITYAGTPYCRNSGIVQVTQTGTPGGIYSASPTGLSLNSTNGSINLASSTPGMYTVSYAVGNSFTQTQVSIRPTQSQFFDTVPAKLRCAGAIMPAISPGSLPGITYRWTNSNTAIGLASTGIGTIPEFLAQNSGSTDQEARITVAAVGGTGCFPTPLTFGITVVSTPVVNAIPNQELCAGQMTTPINFTNAQGATWATWTSDNPAIGVAPSGPDAPGIPAFIALNPTTEPSTDAIFTVTPRRRGCSGQPVYFAIMVRNGVTSLTYPLASYCQNTGAIPNLRGIAGGKYSATPAGLHIDSTTGTLNFWHSEPGTYTVTYAINNALGICQSSASTQVTVLPRVSLGVSYQQFFSCRGGTIPELTFSGSPNGYAWTNSNTAIGLGASGSGSSIAAFTAQNPGNTILRSTVTVTAQGNGTTTCNSLPIPVYLAVGNCNAPLVTQADGTGGDASTLRTQDVTLSPVPARDRVTVQLTTNAYTSRETYTVQLVSQYGGPIGKPAVMNSNVYTVDLSGLTPGVYTLRITSTRTGQGVQKQVVKY